MADRLELRRRLTASPERVFAVWTDPALLARWMSPFAEAEASVDVRVGGTFAIVMRGQGQEIRHTGTYLEVDPPHRRRPPLDVTASARPTHDSRLTTFPRRPEWYARPRWDDSMGEWLC